MEQRTVRNRGLVAAAGLLPCYLLVSGVLLWGTAGALETLSAPGPAPLDSSVALAAAAGAWAVLSWLTFGTLRALLTAAVSGLGSAAHRHACAAAPAVCRRLAGALLGVTIAGAPLATGLPVGAAEAGPAVTAGAPVNAGAPVKAGGRPEVVPSLDRPAAMAPDGWTPDRPVAVHRRGAGSEAAVRLVAATPRAEHAVAGEVVVRRGDTLWDIAARHLGPDSSAAEVAAEWPRWHETNRAAIGPDPDLLMPGERLVPPAGR